MNDITKYIEDIEVDEKELEIAIKWLNMYSTNGLKDYSLNTVVRFLLRRVDELERRLNELEEPTNC